MRNPIPYLTFLSSAMVCAVALAGLFLFTGCSRPAPVQEPAQEAEPPVQLLNREQIIGIAQTVPEVEAFYHLDYRVTPCIERIVKPSCESDYVTCRDNAWVVQYQLSSDCPIVSDGRLSVNLLIDGVTGEIVSRFPEIEYFQAPTFCREDYDCLCSVPKHSGNVQYLNFIHEPLSENTLTTPEDEEARCEECRCQDHVCRPISQIPE